MAFGFLTIKDEKEDRTTDVPYTLMEPERVHYEYLCDDCQDIWGLVEATLSLHGESCSLNVGGVPVDSKDVCVESKYCTCMINRLIPYKGVRLKSKLGGKRCPVCAFIWISAYSLHQRNLSDESAASMPQGSDLTTLKMKVYFHPAYGRSRIEIDGLGTLHFRLYQVDLAYQRRMSARLANEVLPKKSQGSGYLASDKHKTWVSGPKNEDDFLLVNGAFIASQLEYCKAYHLKCKASVAKASNFRLLELTGSCKDPEVRLIECSTDDEDDFSYATLSYCWGTTQSLVTRKTNLSEHLKQIDVRKASPTVFDAIRLALSSGFRYLWVDSLCIVQDWQEDKDKQLGQMCSIYAGAVCTLSIASPKSSNDGFLQPRSLCKRMKFEIAPGSKWMLEESLDGEKDFVDEALNCRAWTLQETLLSQRLITIFSDGRPLHIRCATEVLTSEGCSVLRIPPLLQPMSTTMSRVASRQDLNPRTWHGLVMEYSKRNFTHRTDKLPAFSAIAEFFNTSTDYGLYVAGLFTKAFNHDLMWAPYDIRYPNRTDGPARQCEQEWIAPSWSWMSRKHQVHYHLLQPGVKVAEVSKYITDLDTKVEPISAYAPKGAISTATLTMTCRSRLVVWPPRGRGYGEIYPDDKPWDVENGDRFWFLELAYGESYMMRPRMIGIGSYHLGPGSQGLVLKEVQNSGISPGNAIGVFRRFGIFLDDNGKDMVSRTFKII